MTSIEVTTMCAVFDQENEKVLLINRKKNWTGYAFPGGHLENGESIRDCVIREIFEETGLKLKEVNYIGMTHFYNTESKIRHIVMNFTSCSYEGTIINECDEGEIVWLDIKDIHSLQFAEGMELRLDLFFGESLKEMYVEWNDIEGYTRVEKYEL